MDKKMETAKYFRGVYRGNYRARFLRSLRRSRTSLVHDLVVRFSVFKRKLRRVLCIAAVLQVCFVGLHKVLLGACEEMCKVS